MNCPYCGKEMTTGYLIGGKPIFWSHEKKLGNSTMISPWGWKELFTGSFLDTFFCPTCRKIILDLPDATELPDATSDPTP